MSRWHALDGVEFQPAAAGIAVERWPVTASASNVTTITDALAAPTVDDLAPGAWALLPRGPAWGTPDGIALEGGSMLARFWRAAVDGFAGLYADVWRVTMESTTVTLVAALDDWEAEFGLPDPCVGVYQPDAKRLRWLQEKVRSTGVISPGDYLNMAASLSFAVVIEEPVIFEAGGSDCGGPEETGTPDGNHLVVFWVLNAGEYGFEAGADEAGFTPLYDFDRADAIECRFRELMPAGFAPVFEYSAALLIGWPDIWPGAWE